MINVTRSQFNRALDSAGRSTINKMLTQGRTAAIRRIRQEYNVKAKLLRDYTYIRRATNRSGEGSLTIRGRRLPLILFSPSQRAKGVSIRVKKSTGRKLIYHGFIQPSDRGIVHLWTRTGPTRYPIQPKFTISPAGMFEQEGAAAFEDLIETKMPTTFEHELEYFLTRKQ